MENPIKATSAALFAALLYSSSLPLAKILLASFPHTLLAGFLYLGAGIGMTLILLLQKNRERKKIDKSHWIYIFLMIVLDIIAPVLMMKGLSIVRSENASLLGNFEIVATSIIAFLFFREKISLKTAFSILLITLSSVLLTYNKGESIPINRGSILIILSTVFWGLENNCTRKLSTNDPMKIVHIKGIFSGIGGIVLGLSLGERLENTLLLLPTLIIGFFCYGMSIYLYVYAQRYLGAAKTSAYYAINPFIGVVLALIIFKEKPTPSFLVSLFIMVVGILLLSIDSLKTSMEKEK